MSGDKSVSRNAQIIARDMNAEFLIRPACLNGNTAARDASSYTHAERIKSSAQPPAIQFGHNGCEPKSKFAGNGYPHLSHMGRDIQLNAVQQFAHNSPSTDTAAPHNGHADGNKKLTEKRAMLEINCIARECLEFTTTYFCTFFY